MTALVCSFLLTVWHGDYYWFTSPSAFYWPAKNGLGAWIKKGGPRVPTRP